MDRSSRVVERITGTIPVAVGLGFILVALFVWVKGFNTSVQVWGKFHWLITYEDGFIRRGLAGSLFQYFHETDEWTVQASYIVQINTICSIGIITGLGFWLAARLSARQEPSCGIGLPTIAALFSTSQFLPTVAINTGYLDSILYLLFVNAAILTSRGHYLTAALLGAIAPFIHETFIFLWPPIALFALLAKGTVRSRLICSFAPVVGTLAVLFLHNKDAALAQVMALPMSNTDKQTLLQWQLGQSMSSAFKRMAGLHIRYWPRQFWAFVFYCAPALLMIATYTVMRFSQLSIRKGFILSACLMSPLVALAFGWDLSRFLVVANLTTFTGILMIAGALGQDEQRWPWLPAIAWPIVTLGFFSPLIYAYFETADDVTRGFHPVRGTVLYRAVASFSDRMMNFPPGPCRSSCRRISVERSILTAHCEGGSGGLVKSTLVLSECRGDIDNIDGRLTCANIRSN